MREATYFLLAELCIERFRVAEIVMFSVFVVFSFFSLLMVLRN